MINKTFFTLSFLILVVLLASCSPDQPSPTLEANIPNPASVHCEQNGGTLDLRKDNTNGVIGICVLPNGTECDEWAFFRGECNTTSSGDSNISPEIETSIPISTEFPTPPPPGPEDYQGWWKFTSSNYGFSLLLPPDWVVEETTGNDPLMNGHLLNIHPKNTSENLNIRLTFRRAGEDALLWPTGVGTGEFMSDGFLDVAGQPARRFLLICPSGRVNSIWYYGENDSNIQRGNLEFGFIFGYEGISCEGSSNLEGKIQRLGEMIIASIQIP